ncbi:MAG: hypothetical protein U0638_07145 [Phycisphaerales bacterium]
MNEDSSVAPLGIIYRPTDTPLIESFVRAIDERGYFTANLVRDRVKISKRLVCFLFFKADFLAYACIVSPSGSGSTGQRRVKFTDFVPLDLHSADIEQEIPGADRHAFESARKVSASQPSCQLWQKIWRAVCKLRPEMAPALQEIVRRISEPPIDFASRGAEIVFQTRDALGVALDASGIGRAGAFVDVAAENLDLANLSKGLNQAIREDQIVSRDASRLPGFILERDVMDAFSLRRGDNRLDVFVANKAPLEVATGADLVYFNHKYKSITFVQYKMLNSDPGGWAFYCDSKSDEEIARMNQLRDRLAIVAEHEGVATDYRLAEDPFYFKFVKRERLSLNSDELTKGMYLHLPFLELVTEHEKGPRGGRRISFESAGRWLCNTVFVELLAKGWIGTQGVSVQTLSEVTQALLAERRVLIIASSQKIEHRRGGQNSAG